MEAPPRLPPPPPDNRTWQARAACHGLDTSVFFSPTDAPAASRTAQIRQAKAVCARCPVADACLEYALRSREPYEVWGGRTEAERAEMLGLESLRYPARRARPRRRSAASRRAAWVAGNRASG